MKPTAIEKFAERIQLNEATDCWDWTAHKTKTGYGKFCDYGFIQAHRWSYKFFIADIPERLEIHHKCRNRGCVNPIHLELKTHAENCRIDFTKTHCPRGHEYVEGSFYLVRNSSGSFSKTCIVCAKARARNHYRDNKARHNAQSSADYIKNKVKRKAQRRERYYRLKAARELITSG